MGKTIFFSSHILADVAEICTHIGIIEAGQIVAQGSMEEMRAQLNPHREIMVSVRDDDMAQKVKSLVSGMPDVIAVEVLEPKAGRSRIRIDFTGDDEGIAAINQKLLAEGVLLLGFTEETKDLESMFMRVTKGLVT